MPNSGEVLNDNSDGDIRRQQFLSAVTEGVLNDDHEFLRELITDQDLLQPVELAEYLDIKQRKSEDYKEKKQWLDAADLYLQTLSGREFSPEEVESLKIVIQNLQFARIIDNEEVAEEPVVKTDDLENYEVNDWGSSEFIIKLSEEEINEVSNHAIFDRARKMADRRLVPPSGDGLQVAREMIEENVSNEELKAKMFLVMDQVVFSRSEKMAQGRLVPSSTGDALKDAREIIEKYSSSEESRIEMRLALDKQIFIRAEKMVQGRLVPRRKNHMEEAREMIINNASTPSRANAMLNKLGF